MEASKVNMDAMRLPEEELAALPSGPSVRVYFNVQPTELGAESAPTTVSRVRIPVFGGGVMVVETKSDLSVWVDGCKVEPAALRTPSPVPWTSATAGPPMSEEHPDD